MLDQSFSADNFLRIFHTENRKGNFNKDLLSNEYLKIHEKVKQLFIRRNLGQISYKEFEKEKLELYSEKEEAIQKHLQGLSDICNTKLFKFNLKTFNKDDKIVYTVNRDSASFFAMKQLQNNIAKTFKVKQSNRYDIVKQIRTLLEDGFPKYVIRIDIKSFYESIPQHRLLEKIEGNQLLNFQSKRFIKELIYYYESLKGPVFLNKRQGVPRGVGVSAYLSELYMRDVDNEIKALSDLTYYARYVDDAIIVFVPKSKDMMGNYLDQISKILGTYGLFLKDGTDGGESKIVQINMFKQINTFQFDFLGYKFVIEDSRFKELQLSNNKLEKYEYRLKTSVYHYNKNSKYNEKKARKELINRFKFLTGNFRLINNKKRIKSGIYYSNVSMKDNHGRFDGFNYLNTLIKEHLSNLTPHPGLKVDVEKMKANIIKRYCFHSGFYKRSEKFHSFTEKEFDEITSIWRK